MPHDPTPGPGEVIIGTERWDQVHHNRVCNAVSQMVEPTVVPLTELDSRPCQYCYPDDEQPLVPELVACPCGHGYAERRPEVVIERVGRSGTPEGRLLRTHVYRHEGCPIGGHVVTVGRSVTRRAGPLFHDGRARTAALDGAVALATDGGQP